MTTEQRDDSRELARRVLAVIDAAEHMCEGLVGSTQTQKKAIENARLGMDQVILALHTYVKDRVQTQLWRQVDANR